MRKIKDLTLDELKDLYTNNVKFRDYVFYKVYDDNCDLLCDEEMRNFPGSWEISGVYSTRVSLSYRHFSIKWADVVSWVEEVEKDYSFLWLDGEKDALDIAKQAEKLQEKLDYYDLSDLNFDRIEKKLDELTNDLIERIKIAIDLRTDIDDTYVLEELECCREWMLDELELDDDGCIYETKRTQIA